MPPDDPGLGRSLNNLGLALWESDRVTEARSVWERALAFRESTLGPGHPEVAKVLNNLAILDKAEGKIDDAVGRLERALAIVESRFGETHPQTASALNNLAIAYRYQKRYDAALRALDRALAIQRKIYPGDHARIARQIGTAGSILLRNRDGLLPLDATQPIRLALLGPWATQAATGVAFAQLTYRESLRDIETCLKALHQKLYHCGFRGQVSRNNLANANEKRDWRVQRQL